MPYITKERKMRLNESVSRLNERIESPGELNYVFFTLAFGYLKKFGMRYAILNEIMGVFSSCASEFYRRVVIPYEDDKRRENGDVIDYPI